VNEWQPPAEGQVLSLCVDLNVWVRYLLGIRGGNTRQTAAHEIVDAARNGRSIAGPVQLVVSHTMLSCLQDVLDRLGFPAGDASAFCSLIGAFARRGPYGAAPHVVLGGGTSPNADSRMPVYNPCDPSIVRPRADDKDGRILDTAVAGRAHILATYNFADFETPNTVVLEPGRRQINRAAQHNVLIMQAARAATYLRTGELPAITRPCQ
jgi:hypothetical protein